MSNAKELIAAGNAILGIELGSTRIKAVLIDELHRPIAQGGHDWENRLESEGGSDPADCSDVSNLTGSGVPSGHRQIWTYSLEDIWGGLRDCFAKLSADVETQYGVKLTRVRAMGVSAMMHGYMAFDEKGELLVPFRTWRNTITGEAARKLTGVFGFNIPERWSISHLYQAILNKEAHVPQVKFFTTLAGYLHWKLTGEQVIGIGDASGMFPIDPAIRDYNRKMIEQFDALPEVAAHGFKLEQLLPRVLLAGESAGSLTAEGAKLLDPTGTLEAGIPFCPPEGDAGTGMAATNSVAPRTGNISAGTSVFSMVVLEKPLRAVHPEIDVVTTPDGYEVAMVHCNNCTSDLNAWVKLFKEALSLFGETPSADDLYGKLYLNAMQGDPDCGGLLAYNYFSGESITGFTEGRPLFVRRPDAKMSLSNFMRTHLYTALGALKAGNDILRKEEGVAADFFYGQGGFFKVRGAGDRVMAAALDTEIRLMETAGEGGPWGQALLAAYMLDRAEGETLGDYLNSKVFADGRTESCAPVPEDVAGFDKFMEDYKAGYPIERAAVDNLK